MNRHLSIALMLAACSTPVIAQESSRDMSTVQVHGALYVAECSHRILPSQRQVGEWTGLHNFSEVYAAREHLMAEIGRVCRHPGIAKVQVVREREDSAKGTRYVAVAVPADR